MGVKLYNEVIHESAKLLGLVWEKGNPILVIDTPPSGDDIGKRQGFPVSLHDLELLEKEIRRVLIARRKF